VAVARIWPPVAASRDYGRRSNRPTGRSSSWSSRRTTGDTRLGGSGRIRRPGSVRVAGRATRHHPPVRDTPALPKTFDDIFMLSPAECVSG
jgi:hypothetical protein